MLINYNALCIFCNLLIYNQICSLSLYSQMKSVAVQMCQYIGVSACVEYQWVRLALPWALSFEVSNGGVNINV